MTGTQTTGTLYDYETTKAIRPATADELAASLAAAGRDGGTGAIKVDGRVCYVQGEDSWQDEISSHPIYEVQGDEACPWCDEPVTDDDGTTDCARDSHRYHTTCHADRCAHPDCQDS